MTDLQKIQYALYSHVVFFSDKTRKSTSQTIPYIVHQMEVLSRLYKWGVGTNTDMVLAAIAHDTLEDTTVDEQHLSTIIGKTALSIVKELTYDPTMDKSEYMKTFYSSSLPALVIKIADRICNVYNFLNDGNGDYAAEYFHKADFLWETFSVKRQELITLIGKKSYDKMHQDIVELNKQLI